MWKYAAIEKNLKIDDGAVLTALKSSLFSNVCMYECIHMYETNYVRILMLKTLLSDYQTNYLVI